MVDGEQAELPGLPCLRGFWDLRGDAGLVICQRRRNVIQCEYHTGGSLFSFSLSFGKGYFAQLGCELLPEIRETSFVCFVGTSSKERVRRPPWRRAKTTVREFDAHDGSSPLTSTVAVPPDAGTTQRSNPPICAVNTIHLPSGDQSGSEGFEIPAVEMR